MLEDFDDEKHYFVLEMNFFHQFILLIYVHTYIYVRNRWLSTFHTRTDSIRHVATFEHIDARKRVLPEFTP